MGKRGPAPGCKVGGRKKGTPNKLTGQLKDMILGALADAGGQSYLRSQASENPTAFLTLVGKVLPLQVTGENGPLVVEIVRTAQQSDSAPASGEQ